MYVVKLNSISELEEKGLILMDEGLNIENHIDKYLKKKNITPGDLSKMSGLSRQSINSVMKGRMKPGIDFAMKVSYVLDTPIEELFSLKEGAWIKTEKTNDESTLYVDVARLEIIDGNVRRKRMEEDNYEYFNLETKNYLTKEDYLNELENEINKRLKDEIDKLYENKANSKKRIEVITKMAKDKITEDFNEINVKLYRKLARKISPLINRL